MSPPIHIRPSGPDDLPSLFAVWRRSVLATHDFLSSSDFASIEVEVRDRYLPHAAFWVASHEGDQVQGFMGLSGSHIDALFVDPDYRDRGLGRALVRHAAAQHPRLTVDVNEQNAKATAFYERLGFCRKGRLPVDGAGRPYPLLQLCRDVSGPSRRALGPIDH